MTTRQIELVHTLRVSLLRNGYPKIVIVDNEILEAVECYISEELEKHGEPKILKCGRNGLLFKGCELVLGV